MPKTQTTPLTRYRQRMKRLGVVRVELRVRREDAPLLRSLASALTDPAREAETRGLLLRRRFGKAGLKALLAAAPLDGIDLARSRDAGRDVEL